MAYVANMSGTAQLDNSIVEAFDAAFLVAAGQGDVVTPLAQYRADIGAKSIALTKYGRLALATTPLTEDADVTRTAMADSEVLFTPAEYGMAVTRTALASLQSGGKVDLAAARLVGMNLAETKNKLATLALEATGNVVAGDVGAITKADLDKLYNKLSRASIPFHSGREYVLLAHDDVIADMRADASAGSWTDVTKYAAPEATLANEIGMFKGFRIVRNNHATVNAGSYKSIAMGFNALGLAVSKEPTLVLSGPFDALGRFVNIGWHGVMQFGIVDTDAVWAVTSGSSMD